MGTAVGAAEVEATYPLAPLQEGLLFHAMLEPDQGTYVVQEVFTLCGSFDLGAMARAWRAVADRHPSLRTAFSWKHTEIPVQMVMRGVQVPVRKLDWRGLAEDAQEQRLRGLMETDRSEGFELDVAPLMRVTLCLAAEDRLITLFTSHHAILDGWSSNKVLEEVTLLYAAEVSGSPSGLPPAPPFEHYVQWVRAQDAAAAGRFWKQRLESYDTPAGMLLPGAAGKVPAGSRAQVELAIPAEAAAQLRRSAARCRVTLNTLFTAAWAMTLGVYSRCDDVVFGVVVSGRPPELPEAADMVGLFINTLPLRVRMDPALAVTAWLRDVQRNLAECQQYDYLSLLDLRSFANLPKGIPLFETNVSFANFPSGAAVSALQSSAAIAGSRVVHHGALPISLTVVPDAVIQVWLEHDAVRFDEAAVRRLGENLIGLLKRLAEDPDRALGDVPLTGAAESATLLEAPAVAAPEACLHELIESVAARQPQAVAVRSSVGELTFRALTERAAALAAELAALGAGPESLVAIVLDRTPAAVVAMLGTLRAGAAYVPIDADQPTERIARILGDARAVAVLTSPELARSLPETGIPVLTVTTGETAARCRTPRAKPGLARPDNLAYVIYTSGSTGRPKGVAISHRSLVAYLTWSVSEYALQDGSGAPVHSPLAFDLTVTSLWGPLLAGRPVTMVPAAEGLDGLADYLRSGSDASVVKLTPAHLAILARQLRADEAQGRVRTFVVGGEPLQYADAAFWLENVPAVRIVNEYGPTEATVGCCIHTLEPGGTGDAPIGRPGAGARLALFDRWGRLVAPGMPGELCIGGPGLARGYHASPAATAERFIPDPLAWEPGARLYRTGDLGRVAADGTLDFIGRADQQLKLRGYRIEPGEIEAVLRELPSVAQAAVVVHEAYGDRRLVAYLVSATEESPQAGSIREHLKRRLPEYMLPSAVIWLRQLPLTANGKLDRRALPEPDRQRPESGRPYRTPSTPTEEIMAGIWRDVLRMERVGADDDFFELDGNSRVAVRLVARVGQAFGIEFPLRSIFEARTVAGLSAAVDALVARATESAGWSPLVALQPAGDKPPLFVVHPINGQVLCYLPLAARLQPDQPLYGLQAADEARTVVTTSIEELAGEYISAIKTVQPRGPYHLGGWSLGGMIAFEMAQQLQRAGERIALLAIIDTPVPRGVPDTRDEDDDFAAVLRLFPIEMTRDVRARLALSPPADGATREERLEHALGLLRQEGLLPDGASAGWLRRIQTGYAARMDAVRKYEPVPYDEVITYFRCVEKINTSGGEMTEYHRQLLEDPTFGWGPYARRPIELRVVQGYHDSVVAEPNVGGLARELRACLEQASAADAEVGQGQGQGKQ